MKIRTEIINASTQNREVVGSHPVWDVCGGVKNIFVLAVYLSSADLRLNETSIRRIEQKFVYTFVVVVVNDVVGVFKKKRWKDVLRRRIHAFKEMEHCRHSLLNTYNMDWLEQVSWCDDERGEGKEIKTTENLVNVTRNKQKNCHIEDLAQTYDEDLNGAWEQCDQKKIAKCL